MNAFSCLLPYSTRIDDAEICCAGANVWEETRIDPRVLELILNFYEFKFNVHLQ
jgi:hypothetical protein